MARKREVNFFAKITNDEELDNFLQKSGLISEKMGNRNKIIERILTLQTFQFWMFIKTCLDLAQSACIQH